MRQRRHETPEDVNAAQARGYATAIVVDEFAGRKLYKADGINLLPCPAQTKKSVTCASCGLCMDAPRLLRERQTITFEVHGTGVGKRHARLALTDPNNPDRKKSSRVLIPRTIKSFVEEHGREPTTREIANAIGITPSSVYDMRQRMAAEQKEREEPV